MKNYKKYTMFINDCKKYIEHNNIKCKYFGWCAMCAGIDLVKIDGKIRLFNIKTLEEEKWRI